LYKKNVLNALTIGHRMKKVARTIVPKERLPIILINCAIASNTNVQHSSHQTARNAFLSVIHIRMRFPLFKKIKTTPVNTINAKFVLISTMLVMPLCKVFVSFPARRVRLQ